MGNIAVQYHKTPVGELILGVFDDKLCLCDWKYRKMRPQIDQRIQKGLETTYTEASHPLLTQTKEVLAAYFAGELQHFAVPLLWVGTAFQQQVWQQLMQITYGSTETYAGLAKKMNNLLAIRAVASANGANAISIIVPCHRVIGADGELVGYAGGLEAKKKLLAIEQKQSTLNLFENGS
jgi:methylated-DNA-[protein]-cysteine S-methyltransferase